MSSSNLQSARNASTAVLQMHRDVLRAELFQVAGSLIGAPVQDVVSLDREGFDLAVITIDGRVVAVEDLYPSYEEDDPRFADRLGSASFVSDAAYELECLEALLAALAPVALTSVLV